MRWILLLFLLLPAAGCVLPHLPQRGAETLFNQGIEELADGKPTKSLEELRERFPESTWTRRADVIIRLRTSRENADKRLQKLEKELSACRTKSLEDQEELGRLRNDLEALKKLVIETEKRAK